MMLLNVPFILIVSLIFDECCALNHLQFEILYKKKAAFISSFVENEPKRNKYILLGYILYVTNVGTSTDAKNYKK